MVEAVGFDDGATIIACQQRSRQQCISLCLAEAETHQAVPVKVVVHCEPLSQIPARSSFDAAHSEARRRWLAERGGGAEGVVSVRFGVCAATKRRIAPGVVTHLPAMRAASSLMRRPSG